MGLRRDDNRFAVLQNCRGGSRFRIARAQLTLAFQGLACQQAFGICGRDPSPFFGDADRNDFEFLLVDCLENRGRREQRDFVLAAAAAEAAEGGGPEGSS